MENKLIVSLSPHVHGGDSVQKNMYGVLIALIPAFLVSLYFFGLGAGFGGKYIFLTVLGSFVVSFCAVLCGCRIGMQASKRWKADVSWLGGVLFVILAFQKMI